MKPIKIIYTICLLCIITIFSNSCSKGDSYGSSGTVTTNSTNLVNIQATGFSPAAITIVEGNAITWKNTDTETHTVTSDDGVSFNSGNISPQGSFTLNTLAAGAYPYHCSIHPTEKGTLYVAVKPN